RSCTSTRDGWRLAQIFAPDLNLGAAKYDELVFERERRSGCPRGGGPSGWRRSTSPWEDRVKGGPRPGGPRPRRGRGGR
ncbi:MAG TPA: hypothetical protein VK904_03545, partial [Miltoncostaeaceae bacterium]|nr:hypothetical protein [Miltoncostaeaceae bacterium]